MTFTENFQPIVLTIAGSDPCGGAGIQADLKTFTAVGVYGGAVISSLTVQNTLGVFAVRPVEPTFVKDQIKYVLEDLHVSHIKIGMLGDAAVTKSICGALADFNGEIIYDPVMESSSGRQLIDSEGFAVIKNQLLQLCTVITPNLPEFCRLTGKERCPEDSLEAEAGTLLQQYGKLRSIIITGGHLHPGEKTVTDFLFSAVDGSRAAHQKISHPRIASRNTHGTGCTFSAAFTAYHLLTGSDSEAFQKTCAHMDALLKKSEPFRLGRGTGPLMHHLR